MNKEELNFENKCHKSNYGTFLIPFDKEDVIILLKYNVGFWMIRPSQTDDKTITTSFVENNEIRNKRIDIDEVTESSNSITAIVNKINKREIVNEYNLLDTTEISSKRDRSSKLTEQQLKVSKKIHEDLLIIKYTRFGDTDYKKNQNSLFSKTESSPDNKCSKW